MRSSRGRRRISDRRACFVMVTISAKHPGQGNVWMGCGESQRLIMLPLLRPKGDHVHTMGRVVVSLSRLPLRTLDRREAPLPRPRKMGLKPLSLRPTRQDSVRLQPPEGSPSSLRALPGNGAHRSDGPLQEASPTARDGP
jgi:hypothetical protein